MQFEEYKVMYVTEGGCGAIFLGSRGLPLKRLVATLNQLMQKLLQQFDHES